LTVLEVNLVILLYKRVRYVKKLKNHCPRWYLTTATNSGGLRFGGPGQGWKGALWWRHHAQSTV